MVGGVEKQESREHRLLLVACGQILNPTPEWRAAGGDA